MCNMHEYPLLTKSSWSGFHSIFWLGAGKYNCRGGKSGYEG